MGRLPPGNLKVLVHGLFKDSSSMHSLSDHFTSHGHPVINTAYPSTTGTLDQLAENLWAQLQSETSRPMIAAAARVDFITHSMGGMVVRHMLHQHNFDLKKPGSVVMLGTPNQGSTVIDHMESSWWMHKLMNWQFKRVANTLQQLAPALGISAAALAGHHDTAMNVMQTLSLLGPAFFELTTHTRHPLIPTEHPVCVIAGTDPHEESFPWIGPFLFGKNDGVVTVKSTVHPGAVQETVNYSHTRLPNAPEVHEIVDRFLDMRAA